MQMARCVGLALCAASILVGGCTSGGASTPDGGAGDMAPGAGPDARVAVPPPVTTQWQFEHPVPQGNTLHAAFTAGTDTYAVGELGAVVHLSDQGAKREAVGLTTETLRAVAGTPDNLWIVGDNGIVLSKQQGRWAVDRVGTTPLYAVWLQDTTVYVGGQGQTVWKNSGGGFQPSTLPGQSQSAAIRGAAAQGSEVYLVGSLGRVLHLKNRWILEADGLTSVDLNGVTVADDGTVFAVGLAGRILRKDKDKGTWTIDHPQGTDPPLTRAELRAVFSVTDQMSKSYTVYAISDDGTVLKRGKTGPWQVDGAKVALGRLLSGAGSPGGSFAVGESGTILRRDVADNAPWQNAIPNALLTLGAVQGLATTDNGVAYAVTQDGKILRRNVTGSNVSWSLDVPLNPAPNQPLLAIWAQGSDAYAVGMAGVIMRRTDTGWVPEAYNFTGRRPDLKGVWGRKNGAQLEVYAVGSTSTQTTEETAIVLHKTGDTWAPETIMLNESLYAVSGNDTEVLAVGTRGAIVHRDTAKMAWIQEAAGQWTDIEIFALAPSGGDFFATGTKGAVLRRPMPAMGAMPAWVRQTLPNPMINLTGLAVAGKVLWVSGNGGYVASSSVDRFDMNQWAAESTLSTSNLSGLSLSGSTLLAVGSGGTVLRRAIP